MWSRWWEAAALLCSADCCFDLTRNEKVLPKNKNTNKKKKKKEEEKKKHVGLPSGEGRCLNTSKQAEGKQKQDHRREGRVSAVLPSRRKNA
ncbi:hypothetical protein VTL71DRAFT_5120, partial [Oculimacula yallundae]